jgi:hypothetical protein
MDDKKVILNKTEFDNMETELNNLRKVVGSRTVAQIKIPHLRVDPHTYTNYVAGDYVRYVVGCDENEVVKELSAELEKERKYVDELEAKMDTMLDDMHAFQRRKDDWKHLPWYKRLFVK